MKANIITIWFILAAQILAAQILAAQTKNTITPGSYQVALDKSNEINRNHPYIDKFATEDDLYISWLYATNKKNMEHTPAQQGPAQVISDQDGNNSLVFTLINKDGIKYDTLRNSVHDFRRIANQKRNLLDKLKGLFTRCGSFNQDLRGSLPENAMMWLEDKKWGLDFGVKVPDHNDHVTITVSNDRGKQVTTIVDKPLRKGWNNFKWKRGHNAKGIYRISVTIDGHTMSQNFES